MDIKTLIKNIDGIFLNLPSSFDAEVNSFKMDSRKIVSGDCFIAVNKGYLYIEDALNNGASVIITDKNIHIKTSKAIIKVRSIEDAILCIISYIRDLYKYIPLIAITGSVGKTTTKELVFNILSSKYKVLKNKDNKNNYLGIAETIFMLSDEYDFIVLEIGMNHKGEIKKIVSSIKPDISAITNIGTSHIGNLGSKKDILESKLEIINKKLIVPYSDSMLKKVKYENKDLCKDIHISNIRIDENLKFKLKYQGNKYSINFKIPNKSYISNIIIAFKICTYYNIDYIDIINKINEFNFIKGRMNIIKCRDYTIIDDTYNASYESLKGALDYLKKFKKKMIILGDIKELGIYHVKIHKKINKLLNFIKYRNTLLIGEDTKYIEGIHFKNSDSLIRYLSVLDLTGYTILIKGSRLMHMEKITEFLLQ